MDGFKDLKVHVGEIKTISHKNKNRDNLNLFVITTPNQMLSAIEARNYFGTKNNFLLIIAHKYEKILDLIYGFNFFEDIVIYRKKNILTFIKLLKYLKKFQYKNIFIGYLGDTQKRIVKNINYNKLFILDSSIVTIKTHEEYCCGNIVNVPSSFIELMNKSIKSKIRKFIYYFFGLKDDIFMEKANYFTVFPLQTCKDEIIITHNYAYLRRITHNNHILYMKFFTIIYKYNAKAMSYIIEKKSFYNYSDKDKVLLSPSGKKLNIFISSSIDEIKYNSMMMKTLLHISIPTYIKKNSRKNIDEFQRALFLEEPYCAANIFNNILKDCNSFLISNKNYINNFLNIEDEIKLINKTIFLLRDYFINDIEIYIDKESLLDYIDLLVQYYFFIFPKKEKEFIVVSLFDIIELIELLFPFAHLTQKAIHIIIEPLIENILSDFKNGLKGYKLFFLVSKYKKNFSLLLDRIPMIDITSENVKVWLEIFSDILSLPLEIEQYHFISLVLKSIYNNNYYTVSERILSARLLVKFYIKNNQKLKARHYIINVYNLFGCSSKEQAKYYLLAMQEVDLIKPSSKIFKELYVFFDKKPIFILEKNEDIKYYIFPTKNIFFKDSFNLYNEKPINLYYASKQFPKGMIRTFYNNLDKNKPANLYIIGVLSQMMSAIEIQNYFKTTNNILVIAMANVKDGNKFNKIIALSKKFPYDKLIILRYKKEKGYFPMPQFLEALNMYNYEKIFIGYFTPWYRRIIANLKYKELWMLEDGTYTLAIYQHLLSINQNKRTVFTLEYDKDEYRDYFYKKLNIKMDNNLSNINIFTIFQLDSSIKNKILQHKYDYIKSLFCSSVKEKGDKVYFIGQPYDKLYISEAEYIDNIKFISQKFINKKLIYIPHPNENKSSLLNNFLEKSKKITSLSIEQPIELYLLSSDELPYAVVSFTSTALFALKLLLPDIRIYYIYYFPPYADDFLKKNLDLIWKQAKIFNIESIKH